MSFSSFSLRGNGKKQERCQRFCSELWNSRSSRWLESWWLSNQPISGLFRRSLASLKHNRTHSSGLWSTGIVSQCHEMRGRAAIHHNYCQNIATRDFCQARTRYSPPTAASFSKLRWFSWLSWSCHSLRELRLISLEQVNADKIFRPFHKMVKMEQNVQAWWVT